MLLKCYCRGACGAEQQKRSDKEREEAARLDKISQQTDLGWPTNKGVTNAMLKDQLKKYRHLLGNPDFLGNLSGNEETLINQYLQAVEAWQRKQAELAVSHSHVGPNSNPNT